MFAVIKTGGKQYRVATDQTLTVQRLVAEPGEIVTFPVLILGGEKMEIGTPMVAGASVAAEVMEHSRGDKVIAFKKRRRKNSRRSRGHRQEFTVVRFTEILTGGAKPSKAARPKAEPKPAKTAEEKAEAKAKSKKSKKAAKKSEKSAKSAIKGKKKK
ncbi:MAG TPA: 50S ribosomal protein L21 [Xanthobacteraceae bacterium]|jgi:large subunit ribosomal protein L21